MTKTWLEAEVVMQQLLRSKQGLAMGFSKTRNDLTSLLAEVSKEKVRHYSRGILIESLEP